MGSAAPIDQRQSQWRSSNHGLGGRDEILHGSSGCVCSRAFEFATWAASFINHYSNLAGWRVRNIARRCGCTFAIAESVERVRAKKVLIILASSSPRRIEMMKQFDIRLKIVKPDVDESVRRGERP